jgi:hypothetical protein
LQPQGQEPAGATALFFGLAGALGLLTLLGPVIAARLSKRAWLAPLSVALGAALICVPAQMQPGPPATIEISSVEWRRGEIASTRHFVTCETIPGSPEAMTIDLDMADQRFLARACPAWPGHRAWLIDEPLTPLLERESTSATLADGKIESLIFRDFAAKARRGETGFSNGQARLLDWWLEAYAYRGRDTRLTASSPPTRPLVQLKNTHWRFRGAITVTPLRTGESK